MNPVARLARLARCITGLRRAKAKAAAVAVCLLLAPFALPLPAGAATPQAVADALPAPVAAAAARANVPREALHLLVLDAQGVPGRTTARLRHRADVAANPASVMKLVTTYAALDLLGPSFTWTTPVWIDGRVDGDVLRGNLHIRGQGDPKLVIERIWLLLRRVQALGVRQIEGDIVLDRSAFALTDTSPGQFDGEPYRPYNAAPDALLLNFKSLIVTFRPDAGQQRATLAVEPTLAGVTLPASVPLRSGECGDWRGGLRPDFSDPARLVFNGTYPASCGERIWPLAYADPASYAPRLLTALWRELGGSLSGQVRFGPAPAAGTPWLEFASPPLADVVRDINKYSNNVMAQQVFLTLGQEPQRRSDGSRAAAVGFDAAREVVLRWWHERWPDTPPPVLDNGSGLSRQERISAAALGRMLQSAYQSPVMPELMSSLPVAGVDGTLRRSRARTPAGSAHLKTGSLRDVTALAGYVLGRSGRRYVLVALVNHPTPGVAAAARPVLDALIEWTQADGTAPALSAQTE